MRSHGPVLAAVPKDTREIIYKDMIPQEIVHIHKNVKDDVGADDRDIESDHTVTITDSVEDTPVVKSPAKKPVRHMVKSVPKPVVKRMVKHVVKPAAVDIQDDDGQEAVTASAGQTAIGQIVSGQMKPAIKRATTAVRQTTRAAVTRTASVAPHHIRVGHMKAGLSEGKKKMGLEEEEEKKEGEEQEEKNLEDAAMHPFNPSEAAATLQVCAYVYLLECMRA